SICTVSMKRTRLVRSVAMIIDEVRMPVPKKRTPRRIVPSVTPVAAKMIFLPGAVYCRESGERLLTKWKGWPHRDALPTLPRLLAGACETCGGVEGFKPSTISWLNIHGAFSTGLPDYWILITSQPNDWGQPYYSESNCPRCHGRSIVSQMNYP